MINGEINLLFSDHPLMMVAHDNNILCRTQDSNTHDRTKDKITEDRIFGAVAINKINKFIIITDIRILQFVTNISKVVPSDIFYIIVYMSCNNTFILFSKHIATKLKTMISILRFQDKLKQFI